MVLTFGEDANFSVVVKLLLEDITGNKHVTPVYRNEHGIVGSNHVPQVVHGARPRLELFGIVHRLAMNWKSPAVEEEKKQERAD